MDKAKKKQIKKITSWVLMAALVAALAAMPLLAKAEAEADGPVATVYSGTVETGSVTTTLRGGGTLQTEDVEDVNLPSGVKITEFLVKNGDTVTEGTPLAAVDKVSVMTAILSVRETMDYLQKEIQDARNEKVSSTVSATAGGRIKKVYAQKGDSVQKVMLEHGALALLSLDGLMAVEIEKKMDIPTGDTVTVTLSDGTQITGRIASNLDGVIVITVEDEGYDLGETVTVTTKDGETVGEGELYVHNAWAATAFSGTVKTVSAKEETKVSSGSTLFTLSDTDFQGTLEYVSALHREYEELMQDLFRMYNSGTIDAPCDGMISGIDKDSPHLLAVEAAEPVAADQLSYQDQGWTVILLSNETANAPVAASGAVCDPDMGVNCQASEHDPDCIMACTSAASMDDCKANVHHADCIHSCSGGASCSAKGTHKLECIESCVPKDGICAKEPGYHKDACILSCTHASSLESCKKEAPPKYPHFPDCIKSCIQSDGNKDCPATKHQLSCIESCDHADKAADCDATLHHYPDCIKLCISTDSGSKTCPASKHEIDCFFYKMTYTAKVALVTYVADRDSELIVRWDSSNQPYTVEKIGAGWKFSYDQGFSTDLLVIEGKLPVSNPKAYKPGDVIFVVTGYNQNKEAVWTGIPVFMHIAPKVNGDLPDANLDLGSLIQMPDLSSLLKGFNFSFYAPSPVEEEKLFDLEGSTLMTVSPEKTASLVITLDEQDIAKVSVGQKAIVKVEALGEQTFIAQVTEVANRGTNSGGSSKFALKLEMDKAKNMLDGMSATASLPLETKSSVPVVPVAALAEQGSRTVVYTALDKETGEPANPVPVTLGISDGKYAEILEGLALGDTYYYAYYDTLELDTGVEDRFTLR